MGQVLKVFTDGTDKVVALDLFDARLVWEEFHGSTFEGEGMMLDDWRQLPEDDPITIMNYNDGGPSDKLTKTAAEWSVFNGRGFLCSTEF